MTMPLAGVLTPRRRSVWEAADAGTLLWRENFMYFLPFFALPFWTCAFALRFLPDSFQPWSALGIWLLKPLFDRPLLHIISIRFFEKDPNFKRLFKGLGKSLVRGLPGDLLWRRLSPWRPVMMPVRVLENLKPQSVRQRKKLLVRAGIDFCILLTIWGFLLELILLAGEISFAVFMAKIMEGNIAPLFDDFLKRGELFFFAAWCVNCMLVESLYVCMGFGLYLNSRLELEGWDLQVLFRRFAGRERE
jgi:hypothetical protein